MGSVPIALSAEYGELWPVAMSSTGSTCSARMPAACSHGANSARSAMSPMPQLRDEAIEKSGSRMPARRDEDDPYGGLDMDAVIASRTPTQKRLPRARRQRRQAASEG